MIRQQQIKRYGWKPDLPDQRDRPFYSAYRPGMVLPVRIDFRGAFPRVQDQLDLGSCTAHAIAGAMGALHGKKLFSRLFIYYQERVIERTVKEDAGAQIRDGVKACAKIGVPAELLWPYNTDKFTQKPSASAYVHLMQLTAYQRVNSLNAMRVALSKCIPVVFGFSVYDSFESERVALSGKVPMPKKDEPMLGGHAVCAVGYDDKKKVVICRNSWGPEWGDKGHFTLPYAYVEDRNLSDDFWALRK